MDSGGCSQVGGWQKQPGTGCQSTSRVRREPAQGKGGGDGSRRLVTHWEANQ